MTKGTNQTNQQAEKPSRKFRSARTVTADELKSVLHLPITYAARKLRVFKDSARKHIDKWAEMVGLERWPKHYEYTHQQNALQRERKKKKLQQQQQQQQKQQKQQQQQEAVQVDRSEYGVQELRYFKVKQEDEENGNKLVIFKQQMEFPNYDSERIYDNRMKKGEDPFNAHKCEIEFLPSFENVEFDTHLACSEEGIDEEFTLNYSQMKKLFRYRDCKILEKNIKDRMLGRVSNGFKKTVNSIPITQCSKEIFEYYFDYYGDYCKKKERNLPGYDRIGDFKSAIGTTYTFKYPYLPTFGDKSWTLNEYSLYDETEDVEEEEMDVETTSPCYRRILQQIKQHESFDQGWNHIRNMVYRLTITHNSITNMVTCSFGMVSLKLKPSLTYDRTF